MNNQIGRNGLLATSPISMHQKAIRYLAPSWISLAGLSMYSDRSLTSFCRQERDVAFDAAFIGVQRS
jgi:hypothetical protein